ncbi:hypothetical protein ACVWYQ_003193 [Bradyrhizobium sp. USDA 3397]
MKASKFSDAQKAFILKQAVLSRIFRTFDQATAPVSESCG